MLHLFQGLDLITLCHSSHYLDCFLCSGLVTGATTQTIASTPDIFSLGIRAFKAVAATDANFEELHRLPDARGEIAILDKVRSLSDLRFYCIIIPRRPPVPLRHFGIGKHIIPFRSVPRLHVHVQLHRLCPTKHYQCLSLLRHSTDVHYPSHSALAKPHHPSRIPIISWSGCTHTPTTGIDEYIYPGHGLPTHIPPSFIFFNSVPTQEHTHLRH